MSTGIERLRDYLDMKEQHSAELARQGKELYGAREQLAATQEILRVISKSRSDETPVFDAILSNAARLCQASDAALLMGRPDEPHVTLAALLREDARRPEQNVEVIAETNRVPMKMDPAVHTSAEAICSGSIVHILDLSESAGYQAGEPSFRSMVDDFGIRTCLSVPLFDAQGALGAINLHRRSPKSFSKDEIALVKSFAAQAVIAIENVRQFREIQEQMAQEAATREVLEVISRSREDEQPVFDAILEKAQRLCDAPIAALILGWREEGFQQFAAHRGVDPELIQMYEAGKMPLDGDLSYAARCILDGRLIQFNDMGESDLYKAGRPVVQAMVDDNGVRSVLFVPLIQGNEAIGCITLFRGRDVTTPFDVRQVTLVETFAAQAVIAIENVRQFKALETLNAELGDRVEEQVAEIERMGKLKRFLPAAVADTVVSLGSEKMLKSHRALLGVLFCDIRGFTAFCETAEPEETIEVLQIYHEEMGKLINAHGAGVDHRMGDGIMVLFNDPIPCDDPAGDAVPLAVAMRGRMAELGKDWKRMGFRLGFGVGVSLGYATVGMVGYEGRSDYTASGTAINVASRLCEMAEDGEILLSTRAAIAVEDDLPSVSTGEVTLKGIREPVEVFRLVENPHS